jgi:hypothetical protein
MAAFDHDRIQQMRTMEHWSKDQESDHHRQIRIATFILSLSQLANDLHRLRRNCGHYPDATTSSLMAAMEKSIRQHSIGTFGKDIFEPGDPTELRSPTLPPEGPHLARSNLGCFIKTYFPKAEFGMDIAAFAARTRADRNNHFLDSTSLAELVLKKDPSPTLPPEGPQQTGEKP